MWLLSRIKKMTYVDCLEHTSGFSKYELLVDSILSLIRIHLTSTPVSLWESCWEYRANQDIALVSKRLMLTICGFL